MLLWNEIEDDEPHVGDKWSTENPKPDMVVHDRGRDDERRKAQCCDEKDVARRSLERATVGKILLRTGPWAIEELGCDSIETENTGVEAPNDKDGGDQNANDFARGVWPQGVPKKDGQEKATAPERGGPQ